MGKITGQETKEQLPEKVLLLYRAVLQLVREGADFSGVKVSDITDRAGIGKGTAYDYFDSKEEMIARALLFFMEEFMEELVGAIEEKTSFREKVACALDPVDVQKDAGVCMLRFVNLFLEPSQTGQLLRENIQKYKQSGQCRPLLASRKIVEEAIAAGEIKAKVPVVYLSYMLVTKFISYHAVTAGIQYGGGNMEVHDMFFNNGEMTKEEFKEVMIESILNECKCG